MDRRSYNPIRYRRSRPTAAKGSFIRAMEVLRWFAVFVIAVLLMVAGLFWLMGRPLPIPHF